MFSGALDEFNQISPFVADLLVGHAVRPTCVVPTREFSLVFRVFKFSTQASIEPISGLVDITYVLGSTIGETDDNFPL